MAVPESPKGHLPTQEPQQQPDSGRRQELERELEELSGTLRYMGKGHPKRGSLEQRAHQLRAILEELGVK